MKYQYLPFLLATALLVHSTAGAQVDWKPSTA